VLAAIEDARRDVDGCFLEWVERADSEHRPLDGDAELAVDLSVTPDGVGHSAKAKGMESPSLMMCVESALGRVHYPHGKMQLDLNIAVQWSGDGQQLNMTGRVVGQHEASGRNLDLH
jgi:hypothetical protein